MKRLATFLAVPLLAAACTIHVDRGDDDHSDDDSWGSDRVDARVVFPDGSPWPDPGPDGGWEPQPGVDAGQVFPDADPGPCEPGVDAGRPFPEPDVDAGPWEPDVDAGRPFPEPDVDAGRPFPEPDVDAGPRPCPCLPDAGQTYPDAGRR